MVKRGSRNHSADMEHTTFGGTRFATHASAPELTPALLLFPGASDPCPAPDSPDNLTYPRYGEHRLDSLAERIIPFDGARLAGSLRRNAVVFPQFRPLA